MATEADQLVAMYTAILKDNGIDLDSGAHVLDYGCGTGRLTYAYRDAGYRNAFGYDIQNYLELRSPADAAMFRLDHNSGPINSFPAMTGIPWPDNSFDFVFATSVFEHVMDQPAAYREVLRVLKPGGVFLNIFPSKWRPIEAHIFVPFGGVTKSKAYFRFWAALGIRNGFQAAMGAAEVAEDNARFARRGVNYLTGGEINRILAGIFSRNTYVELSFAAHSPGRSRYIAPLLQAVPPLRAAFRFAHTRVILSQK